MLGVEAAGESAPPLLRLVSASARRGGGDTESLTRGSPKHRWTSKEKKERRKPRLLTMSLKTRKRLHHVLCPQLVWGACLSVEGGSPALRRHPDTAHW